MFYLDLTESKKSKKKKRLKSLAVFAPFYGSGNGTSGATFPRFRTSGQSDSHGPSFPGEGGINSPDVPVGANAGTGPLVASVKEAKDGIYSSDKLPKDVKLDSDHDPENTDSEYSYRLQNLDTVYYEVEGDSIWGHIGLDDDNRVKAVFVDPTSRNQGVATKLYVHAAQQLGAIHSDDPDAIEPGAVEVWKKLKAKYPKQVKQNKDKSWTFTWKLSGLKESTHLCLVCANTGKVRNIPCSLCGKKWKTRRFAYGTSEPQQGMIIGDPTRMTDVDRGWDIDLGI